MVKLITDQDLGYATAVACNRLRNLDLEHRIILLTHCFSINEKNLEDANKKAILIAKLMEMQVLFDDRANNDFIKNIQYEIYWSISYGNVRNTDRPYYKLEETVGHLEKILKQISDGEKRDPRLKELKQQLNQELEAIKEFHLPPSMDKEPELSSDNNRLLCQTTK